MWHFFVTRLNLTGHEDIDLIHKVTFGLPCLSGDGEWMKPASGGAT